jgi:SnoaL-like protein
MSSLDVADRLELAELIARYGLHFDDGDGPAWAALFAADGTFVGPNGQAVTGTKELAALPPAGVARTPGIRHVPGPLVLDADTDGVLRGRSYIQAVRPGPDGGLELVVAGEYHDTFIRVSEGWRFQQRRFVSWGTD